MAESASRRSELDTIVLSTAIGQREGLVLPQLKSPALTTVSPGFVLVKLSSDTSQDTAGPVYPAGTVREMRARAKASKLMQVREFSLQTMLTVPRGPGSAESAS